MTNKAEMFFELCNLISENREHKPAMFNGKHMQTGVLSFHNIDHKTSEFLVLVDDTDTMKFEQSPFDIAKNMVTYHIEHRLQGLEIAHLEAPEEDLASRADNEDERRRAE